MCRRRFRTVTGVATPGGTNGHAVAPTTLWRRRAVPFTQSRTRARAIFTAIWRRRRAESHQPTLPMAVCAACRICRTVAFRLMMLSWTRAVCILFTALILLFGPTMYEHRIASMCTRTCSRCYKRVILWFRSSLGSNLLHQVIDSLAIKLHLCACVLRARALLGTVGEQPSKFSSFVCQI